MRTARVLLCLLTATITLAEPPPAMGAQISLRYLHQQSLSLEPSYYAMNGYPGGKPKFMGTHGYIAEVILPSQIGVGQTFMQGSQYGSLQGFNADLQRRELGAEISYRLPLSGPLYVRPFAHLGWMRSHLWLDSVSQTADSVRMAAGAGLLLHKHNKRSRVMADAEAHIALEAPIPSRFEPAGRWNGNLLTFGFSIGIGGGSAPWYGDTAAEPARPDPEVLTPQTYPEDTTLNVQPVPNGG